MSEEIELNYAPDIESRLVKRLPKLSQSFSACDTVRDSLLKAKNYYATIGDPPSAFSSPSDKLKLREALLDLQAIIMISGVSDSDKEAAIEALNLITRVLGCDN